MMLEKWGKLAREEKILYILVSIYIAATTIYMSMKHIVFETRAYDLGIFMQALWTTIHEGKFFYETPDLWIAPNGSFFGVHFSPIMFLLLALYYIAPSAYTLLSLQSILFGIAAIPLYQLAKKILNKKSAALLFSILYLAYPATIGSNLYDFHLEVFFPIVLFSALYYMETKQWIKFYATLTINLTILDFASLMTTAALMIYATYIANWRKIIGLEKMDRETKKFVIATTVLNAAILVSYYYISTTLIKMFGNEPMTQTTNWEKLGNGLKEIMIGMLDPSKVIASLSHDATTKILWIAALLIPLGFLPLYAPKQLLLPAPIIWMFLLATYPPYYQLGYQYGAIYEAFIFYAAIHGYKNTQKHREKTGKNIADKILEKTGKIYRKTSVKTLYKALLIITLILYTAGITTNQANKVFIGPSYQDPLPIPNQHTKAIQEALALIPENATVLAQNNIFPHLAHRTNAYAWIPEENLTQIEYAIADTTSPEYKTKYPGATMTYEETIQKLINEKHYETIYQNQGIIVIKKPGN